MIGASLKDPLKKLPFTIPELVAASPCKSSDGTLYTGKKVDTWFSIDRFTGRKKVIIMFQRIHFVAFYLIKCPNSKHVNFNFYFIREQYHLVDALLERKKMTR